MSSRDVHPIAINSGTLLGRSTLPRAIGIVPRLGHQLLADVGAKRAAPGDLVRERALVEESRRLGGGEVGKGQAPVARAVGGVGLEVEEFEATGRDPPNL